MKSSKKSEIIPKISNFYDLLKKLEYDLKRYNKNNHSYEFIDCIMSLNALPEWIKNSTYAKDSLKKIAIEKETIMKGNNGFKLDESKIMSDIDHQLRFIRLFCNHSKHKTDSGHIPCIISKYGATFPITFPGKLQNIITIGKSEFDAESLLNNTFNFWKENIEKNMD
ncbi:hypothetical protein QYR09_13860 [Cellulophaga lytica]|nr:hypothetical protein QYR09_13860 [Cellulophaga lytica]